MNNITPTLEQINKYSEIFIGSETNRGQVDGGNTTTEKLTLDAAKHLSGILPQGLSPNRLDIENKTAEAHYLCCDLDLGYQSLEAQIELAQYLIPFDAELRIFKSKSKGYHIYKFLNKFYPSEQVRKKAKALEQYLVKKYKLAVDKGHTLPASFRFEKKLQDGTKVPDLSSGNWLNLPYLGLKQRTCLSVCGNYELTFDEFCLSYDLRKHKKLAALIGKKTVSTGRHDDLFGAAGYIKHYLKDDEELFKKIAASMGFTEYDWFTGGKISRQWDQRINHDKEYYDNYTFGRFRNIVNLPDYKDIKPKIDTPTYDVIPDWMFEDAALIKEPEQTETNAKGLISYCYLDFKKLKIPKPNFIMERLFKDHSINYISGPKGNGKSEIVLGLTTALSQGKSFLKYTCPEAVPVCYIDGEMDPYDILERKEQYDKCYGLPEKNFYKIINYAQQFKETIPDIKEPLGQKLILDQALLQEKQTGKKPLIVLDNLRSLSNYKENDSDEYRLINSWLLKLRGLKFSIIVIDHHGKAVGGGPRGTSSKTDNANLSILINSVKEKGNPNMVMKVAFDKARGLKPDETEEFEAIYDFDGRWTYQDARTKNNDDEAICKKIKEITDQRAEIEKKWQRSLDEDLKKNKVTPIAYGEICKNHKNKYTQKELAAEVGVSAGKVNMLLKVDGPYDQYCKTLNTELEIL